MGCEDWGKSCQGLGAAGTSRTACPLNVPAPGQLAGPLPRCCLPCSPAIAPPSACRLPPPNPRRSDLCRDVFCEGDGNCSVTETKLSSATTLMDLTSNEWPWQTLGLASAQVAAPAPAASAPAAAAATGGDAAGGEGGLSGGAIAGIVVGCLAACAGEHRQPAHERGGTLLLQLCSVPSSTSPGKRRPEMHRSHSSPMRSCSGGRLCSMAQPTQEAAGGRRRRSSSCRRGRQGRTPVTSTDGGWPVCWQPQPRRRQQERDAQVGRRSNRCSSLRSLP